MEIRDHLSPNQIKSAKDHEDQGSASQRLEHEVTPFQHH